MECVELKKIIYFQAEQKYVVVHHQGGRLLLEHSLKSLERSYADRFLRIHRNALVSRQRLTGIDKGADGRCYARLLGCDDHLEISRRHQAEIRAWLRGG